MKKKFYFTILELLRKGKRPSEISKLLNVSKQALYYYIKRLKQKGIIEKVGYGSWKVKEDKFEARSCLIDKKREIRGHAFIWRVSFIRKIDWEKRLNKFNFPYKLIGSKKSIIRIIFRNKKIWLTKKGMVIYEASSYLSDSSRNSRSTAIFELDKTVKMLGKRFQINLGEWQFTTSREHYGMIKHELARQYDKGGNKLYVRDNGGVWLWIDHSYNLDELETNNPKDSRGVQNWWNDHKKHNFEIGSSFILDIFKKTGEQLFKTSKIIEDLSIEIKNLKTENKDIKEKLYLLNCNNSEKDLNNYHTYIG